MADLPPRPKPGYVPGCGVCERRRTFDGGIACADHRTADEWSWLLLVTDLAGLPAQPVPTLF